jgi:hypothetical protein
MEEIGFGRAEKITLRFGRVTLDGKCEKSEVYFRVLPRLLKIFYEEYIRFLVVYIYITVSCNLCTL